MDVSDIGSIDLHVLTSFMLCLKKSSDTFQSNCRRVRPRAKARAASEDGRCLGFSSSNVQIFCKHASAGQVFGICISKDLLLSTKVLMSETDCTDILIAGD